MATEERQDCVCGGCREEPIPSKDWVVTRLVDHGPGQFYRYHVEGENLNYPPCHASRRFSWTVPELDRRFDLSKV